MKTIKNPTEINALISLLEDPSETVFESIEAPIYALGKTGIPFLQEAFENNPDDELLQERLLEILDRLKLETLESDLSIWKNENSLDLLDGMIKVANYGYPTISKEDIKPLVEEMAFAISEHITDDSTPEEIIHAFNQVILYEYGFNGNTRSYSALNNSFINKLVETKVGNPIGLSVLYLLIAEELNLPIVGINSPKHFIVAYTTGNTDVEFSSADYLKEILFYVDPFQNGMIMQTHEFESLLEEIEFKKAYWDTIPATNRAIITRVMNNLVYALYIMNEKTTAKKVLAVNEKIFATE